MRVPVRGFRVVGTDTPRLAQRTWVTHTEQTPAGADELSLVRIGRFVVSASILVAFVDSAALGFSLFSLLSVVLYVGYVVVYWPAVRTRRFEAAALGGISLSLAALHIAAVL